MNKLYAGCAILLAGSSLLACGEDADKTGATCKVDGDCKGNVGGLVCDQASFCTDSATLQTVRARWTLKGLTPGGASCSAYSRLVVEFKSPDGATDFGFDPVPCPAGMFTINKVPSQITKARVIAYLNAGGTSMADGFIDPSGNVSINVP
jgi:hypothetical protein